MSEQNTKLHIDTIRAQSMDAVQKAGVGHPGLMDELALAGVDYDDVTETLDREGVQKLATRSAR